VNLSRYVGNGATNATDPSGLEKKNDWVLTPYLIDLRRRGDRAKTNTDKLFVFNPLDRHFALWIPVRVIFYDAWVVCGRGIDHAYSTARHGIAKRASDPTLNAFENSVLVVGQGATYPMEVLTHLTMRGSQATVYAISGGPLANTRYGGAAVNFVRPAVPYVFASATGLHGASIATRLTSEDPRDSVSVGEVTDFGLGIFGTYFSWRWAKMPVRRYGAEATNGCEVASNSGTNRIYSARELIRRSAEPGPFHNFPESFNKSIFEQGTKTRVPNFFNQAKPGLSADSIQYRLPGTVNGREGVFEIFTRPSISGNTEVIIHRFFNPIKP